MGIHAILWKLNEAVRNNLGNVLPDFKSYGIKTDVIAESTAATGVTVDGVLLKDNAVTASGGFTGNVTGNVTGNLTGILLTRTLVAKDATSGNVILTSADFGKICLVDNGTNARAINLPTVVAGDAGKCITIFKSAGATGALTVTPEATGTINGAANHAAIDALYDTATFMVTAAKTWIIIDKAIA